MMVAVVLISVMVIPIVIACAPTTAETNEQATAPRVTEIRINPVEQAGPARTARIEILELDLASDSPTRGEHVVRLTIDNPRTVEQILAALDTDLNVAPKVECIPEYRLLFHLDDGTVQEVGYSCGGASFLRGEQEFWEGKDFRPPDEFNALIQAQLAATLPSYANVAEQTGLDRTGSIDVFESVSSEVADSPGVVEARIVERLTIIDPQLISAIVAALDQGLPLGPRVRCPMKYILHFHLDDGSMQSFGYGCDPENPHILRGEQRCFLDQDATVPSEFDVLIREKLASAP
jgi:hypothetical protein